MSPLPIISGAQCIATLARFGYVKVRQQGSHVRLNAPGMAPVSVPLHYELKRGTLRGILRETGIDVATFVEALGR